MLKRLGLIEPAVDPFEETFQDRSVCNSLEGFVAEYLFFFSRGGDELGEMDGGDEFEAELEVFGESFEATG